MKIEGYFISLERSNVCLSKLQSAGFTNSRIEIDDNNRNIKRNLADSDSAYSLRNLVIDPSDMSKSPLTSISPIVNVTAGFSEFYDNNYKVVIETDKSLESRAKEIIKSLGGSFRNEGISLGRVNEDVGELNKTFKDNDI